MDNVEIDEQRERVLKNKIASLYAYIECLEDRKNKIVEDYDVTIEYMKQAAERKSKELFEMYGAKEEQERGV